MGRPSDGRSKGGCVTTFEGRRIETSRLGHRRNYSRYHISRVGVKRSRLRGNTEDVRTTINFFRKNGTTSDIFYSIIHYFVDRNSVLERRRPQPGQDTISMTPPSFEPRVCVRKPYLSTLSVEPNYTVIFTFSVFLVRHSLKYPGTGNLLYLATGRKDTRVEQKRVQGLIN